MDFEGCQGLLYLRTATPPSTRAARSRSYRSTSAVRRREQQPPRGCVVGRAHHGPVARRGVRARADAGHARHHGRRRRRRCAPGKPCPPRRASVSPLRFASIEAQREADRENFESIGVDFATFDDPGLAQHLLKYRQQYWPRRRRHRRLPAHAARRRYRRRPSSRTSSTAVTLHEVGHNMGCRHNFRGSCTTR